MSIFSLLALKSFQTKVFKIRVLFFPTPGVKEAKHRKLRVERLAEATWRRRRGRRRGGRGEEGGRGRGGGVCRLVLRRQGPGERRAGHLGFAVLRRNKKFPQFYFPAGVAIKENLILSLAYEYNLRSVK